MSSSALGFGVSICMFEFESVSVDVAVGVGVEDIVFCCGVEWVLGVLGLEGEYTSFFFFFSFSGEVVLTITLNTESRKIYWKQQVRYSN